MDEAEFDPESKVPFFVGVFGHRQLRPEEMALA
jgi:hypothetical protein